MLDIGQCEGLLKSKLVLDKGHQAGVGDCEDCFLCAEVEDEDLPWDVDENDW